MKVSQIRLQFSLKILFHNNLSKSITKTIAYIITQVIIVFFIVNESITFLNLYFYKYICIYL